MPEDVLRVGDRVNVEGREGVFYVLQVYLDTRSASLLPSDDGPVLRAIPMGTLRMLPRPDLT